MVSTTDSLKLVIVLICLHSTVTCVNGINIRSAFDLHEHLLTNYSSDIRPVHNDSQPLDIQVFAYLIQIFNLDEVAGELVTSLSLSFTWFDENFKWDPAEFEGRHKMEFDVTKIWRPALKLLSPSQQTDRLGKEGDIAVVYAIGIVTMTINDIFFTSCAVQITYFPFDLQYCDIWFAIPEYGKLLTYTPYRSEMDTSFFFENPIWKVKKTTLKSVSTGYNNNIVCGIVLERRATFYVLNLLTPIIILMVLNSMVFALPAESGERVGFSVTLLLSVAVYMTIISDKLPNSSKPSPILTYVLVAYLAQSALICIKTILSLRMHSHNDDDSVSKVLSSVVRILRCCICSCRSHEENKTDNQCENGIKLKEKSSSTENRTESFDDNTGQSEITWKANLLTNYTSDARPVHNDSVVTNIRVSVALLSLRRLDEITGELVTGLLFYMQWTDAFLKWDPSDYGGRKYTQIDVTKIWRPALQLFSPSEKSIRLGRSGDKAIVYNGGGVSMQVNEIFYTSCIVQILYYPFDSHRCYIWFSSPEYFDRLKFHPVLPKLAMSMYAEHALWEIEKTAFYDFSKSGAVDFLVCEIHLRRRATFSVLNMLIPIVILMFLNSMVFALPAESGERVGFSVTILLSIAVYMSIISDKLPNSSKPTPILMYVLGSYLTQSAIICVTTIATLRMYYSDKEEPITPIILCVVRALRCKSDRSLKARRKSGDSYFKQDEDCSEAQSHGQNENNISRRSVITWIDVSKTFDKIFLIFNGILCFSIAIVYLCLIIIQPFDNE
ncbi:hypothetical protein FSP39_014937 [Pinctada imbricata]|uniref:Uncharacterized protein n=1 Tax=Pinctada imbricata TaxID=66713 RepID=A0AA89CAV4_PINIB|nr:hypothetical protein FSP39_014937 [Pinctada imbricata]